MVPAEDGLVALRRGGEPELNALELKHSLAEQQGRSLSGNTIHRFFQVINSFANWFARENPVDPSLLRMRPRKVALRNPPPEGIG